MVNTIRTTDYTGDLDTLREVHLIGPFETAAARDAEIDRLYTLPGISGGYDFEESSLETVGADSVVTAAESVKVTNGDELSDAMYAI